MDPERWRKIDQLLSAALEREGAQRASFLSQACEGDEQLRAEVQRLIAAHQASSDFLEPPSGATDAAEDLALRQELQSLLRSNQEAKSLLASTVLKGTLSHEHESLVGHRIGSYKLLRQIGHGGMGIVYLADRADEHFRQRVAIKLVRRGMDTEGILRRFKNERQILASFNHPNIARLLDGGTTEDGRPYFVMELIEGKPLYDFCDTNKLSIPDRLNLFCDICSAVHYAHQNLIVHRDLKPRNILVTGAGVPKLLDFGIAKFLNLELSSQTIEATGSAIRWMTPEYASPEQIRGQPITAASDIYSLGVLLYQLLTGHRPYRARRGSADEMAKAICEDEPEKPSTAISRVEEVPTSDGSGPVTITPESVSQTRSESPEQLRRRLRGDLDNIVFKALQKEPSRRYASAQELSQDIQRYFQGLPIAARRHTFPYRVSKFVRRRKMGVAFAALSLLASVAIVFAWQARLERERLVPRPVKALAVLPLINSSTDPGMEYLTDGISESIINSLSQLSELRVIARTTSFRYKGRQGEPQAVGRELAVDAVLTGHVLQRADSLTLQVDLVNVLDGSQLWGQHFIRRLSDIFSVEEEVAQSVAEALRVRLSGLSRKQVAKRYTESIEAYQSYLRGRYFCEKRMPDALHRGIDEFQKAIDLDPTYALAYSGMADCYGLLANYQLVAGNVGWSKAKAAALRAAELDDSLAEPHVSLGFSKMFYDWDWSGAENEFKRALQLNPNYEVAHHWYGILLWVVGRFDQSRAELKRAQMLDPLSYIINVNMGRALYYSRQYDQAIEQLKKTVELNPESFYAHSVLVRAYEQAKRYNEALAQLQAIRDPYSQAKYDGALAYTYAVSGRQEEARAILGRLIAEPPEYFVELDIADIYVALGENERAFEWLERAYGAHLDWLIYINAEPRADPIRSDPRFANLLRRMKLGP
jgi:serine/threonine protein kinase/Tfp pilus assembly protein PilF